MYRSNALYEGNAFYPSNALYEGNALYESNAKYESNLYKNNFMINVIKVILIFYICLSILILELIYIINSL